MWKMLIEVDNALQLVVDFGPTHHFPTAFER
jgi:hypothetical protein